MADGEAKKEKGGIGRIILLAAGGVALFLGAIPFFLLMNGILNFEAPRLRPAEAYVLADSVLVAYRMSLEEAAEAPPEGSPSAAGAVAAEIPAGSEAAPAAIEGPMPASVTVAASTGGTGAAETHGVPEEADYEMMGPPIPESMRELVNREEEAAEENLDQMMALQPERMARLVRVYEKMRPKQVALILGTMPERQASSILRDMKDQSAAKVLAEMEPNKAARMSQLLIRAAG
ncbi:MAG: hypothetical protein ABIK65_08575 [Candidatus Eisenbacteria bacterium]